MGFCIRLELYCDLRITGYDAWPLLPTPVPTLIDSCSGETYVLKWNVVILCNKFTLYTKVFLEARFIHFIFIDEVDELS